MPSENLRIIYNQDCTNLFGIVEEPITPAHVDRMVDEVADGGADAMLINPNAQRVNYPSDVWPSFWDGYQPGNREFFGPVPEDTVAGRDHWVGQMKRLHDAGCDYVEHALARCRAKGITPGISVRMNDMHDVPWLGSHLFSSFYLDHPEWRLTSLPARCGWGSTGLNYEHREVRDHYLALIRELLDRYDFEMLELDFLRFQSYFPRSDFEQHAAVMTGFVGEVSELLGASGKRIELIPRVATSPAAAYELGFDAAAWAENGSIDGLTAGAFLNTNWDIPVDEFRAATGGRVPVYAGTDVKIEAVNGIPARHLPLHGDFIRGLAAGYSAIGADGLNFFNFFCTRERGMWGRSGEPLFGAFAELRSPTGLRGKAKAYAITGATNGGTLETDRPSQAPVILPAGSRRDFRMPMMAEATDVAVEVQVRLSGDPLPEPGQLLLHVNACCAGWAADLTPIAEAEAPVHAARFPVPPQTLDDGWNRLMLRNEGPDVTILGLDVKVEA